ncbi:MAG: FHIPEP family type III secretion protein [Rhodospirillales bacterium]|nr:FHIPEP family type III secretion protein [Rhodospirillales bacterium]
MADASTETTATGISSDDVRKFFKAVSQRGDIAMALGVVAILVVLILPLPKWLMDVSLAFSITFSVLILMTALFIHRPLEFNSFPTVLLLATMLRLSLNLASTRLILAGGHEGTDAAGKVIEAFGSFVMGGNFVIGIIVFAILIIVNFIVITKGASRIAEVSARFALDAMPGKQMAIDADLSTGLIDEDQAKKRRKDLEDESTFFGSMDGAAKFVRGDVIAGLLITFINIIAGMIIGVAQMDLTFAEAADTYTRLTVGDGLVTQIPALIVSTAAGMVVTKAGITGATEKALFRQLGGEPRAIWLSALGEDLTLLSATYDRVVIDLGAGLEQTVRQLTHNVGTCLVIATDDPSSLTDAYAFIKVTQMERPGTDIRVVINMASSVRAGERTYNTLLKACEGFLKISPPLMGIIRNDSNIRETIRNQSPLLTRHPNSEAAADVEAIAAKLMA